MKYIIKNNKSDIRTIETNEMLIYIKPDLFNIYQNSPIIENELMQTLKWKDYGCRAAALYRLFMHELQKQNKIASMMDFTIKDFDKLADSRKDWSNDIMNGVSITESINIVFGTKFEWDGFLQGHYDILDIIKLLNQDVGLCAHMRSLANPESHFISIIGYLSDEKGSLYYIQKETYDGYDGYNYLMDVKTPEYLEVIQ